MERATGEFARRGLHLPESKHRESMKENTFNFIKNYIKAYIPPIIRVAMLSVQPYLFLNINIDPTIIFNDDSGM